MRNLKKILALVLALVMSLSLMATAGAGSFQDVTDDNPYKTAIDVLDELKVFQGFEDGSFKPTESLNRAQAAVLVYRIATGDVEGKYVANYTDMAQSKFDDLTGYEWARGYINYCQNAKIVVGTSATKFSPEKNVTGYQLMVMLLRTLGYGAAGEFADPTSWELETAKIAEREGILKNITGGNYGEAAPRQMVAEILFQGLLQETVKHSALTPGGYTKTGEILGKNVGLEEITGVVTANEIADLDDTTPLEAGKTRLETEEGRIYTLDVASAATDIGETRHAYIQNGTKVLGVLADTGDNKINDNPGVGTTLSKVVKDMNVRLTDETQYYINFGDSEQYACERRLEYNVTFDNTVTIDGQTAQKWFEAEYGVKVADVVDNKNALDEVKGDSYTRVIPAEKNITEDDLAIMRGIFSCADDENADVSLGITGYVFAGTNSKSDLNRNKDLSEDISWREFYRDYINPAAYNISGSDNGEWFKVIDNDNDGNVDYVLLTRFVMTTITDYNNRTGYYTTEWTAENEEDDHTKFLDIHKDDIVSVDGEDLAIDDVILYAKIDGKYYVDHPDTVDTSITKFTYKTDTITCADEQDRVWSGIDKEAAAFFEDITDPEMETKRPYTLYLDHFGYVRLVTDTSKGFVLLTDGYYETNRRDSVMKATVYDLAAEKLEDVTVVKDAGKSAYSFQDKGNNKENAQFGYIDTWEDDHNGNRGTWERLSTFGMYRYGLGYEWDKDTESWTKNTTDYFYGNNYDAANDIFKTNVALASIDGEEYSLSDIGANNSRSTVYNSYQLNEDFSDFNGKARNLTGIVSWDDTTTAGVDESDTIRINTTSNTRYYWVTLDDNKNTVVETWLGFSNAPDGFSAERGYAITSTVTSVNEADANYEIAQVVVFEGKQTTTEYKAMIPYAYAANKRYQGLGWDGEDYSDESKVDNKTANAANLLNSVYDMDGDKITEDYGKYGLWAGYVVTSRDTNKDYYEFSRSETSNEPRGFFADEDPAAKFEAGEINKAYRVIDKRTGSLGGYATETADLKLGERVIYFVDSKANVQLVINVNESDSGAIYSALFSLWSDIIEDYANAPSPEKYTVEIDKVTTDGTDNLEDVVELVDNVITEDDVKDFALTFNMLDGAYSIIDVLADNATVAKVGDVWHLFNATGNVKLTIQVANDGKHSLTAADGKVERYTDGEQVSMDVNIGGSYFTLSDAEGNFYKADGKKWTAGTDGLDDKFIPTWTTTGGVASVAEITMPAADVTIDDGYYIVGTWMEDLWAKAGETVTVTIASEVKTPFWYVTYEDGTKVWLDTIVEGTDEDGYVVKTGTFEMPAQSVDAKYEYYKDNNTSKDLLVYYKIVVDGNEDSAVYADQYDDWSISNLVTGDYYGYELDENGVPTGFKAKDDTFALREDRADENGVINVLSGYYQVTLKDDDSLVDRVVGGIKKDDAYYFTSGETITIVPKADKTFTVNGGDTVYDGIGGGYTTAVKGSAKLTIAAPTP